MTSRSPVWEHFPHDADVGIRGRGASAAIAFEQAATAMTAAVTEPESVQGKEAVAIECHAPDLELLLVEWLNALVFEMATRRMLFGRYKVRIDKEDDKRSGTAASMLTGEAIGEVVNRERHSPAAEVKGATYTGLRVREDRSGEWTAECVIDV